MSPCPPWLTALGQRPPELQDMDPCGCVHKDFAAPVPGKGKRPCSKSILFLCPAGQAQVSASHPGRDVCLGFTKAPSWMVPVFPFLGKGSYQGWLCLTPFITSAWP